MMFGILNVAFPGLRPDVTIGVNADQHQVNRLAGDGVHDRETIRHTRDLGHR